MTSATDKELTTNLLNKMRAAVLGANDGIVSTASVVMGVAGATSNHQTIATAGLAALVAGALSMAVGEYVSVSSQSDAEKAYIAKEKQKLSDNPELELKLLAEAYEQQGITKKTAMQVAKEVTKKEPLKAHLRMHFGIDQDDIISPMQAAVASLFAFTAGGLVPFVAMVFSPEAWRIWVTIAAVTAALVATGYFSAVAGEASRGRAIGRILAGGLLAMIITYYVGVLFGTAIG